MSDYRHLYVFVEGNDDERFFERILKDPLCIGCDSVDIIQHRKMKREKIDAFIKSINSMPCADYIYTEDLDKCTCFRKKKQKIGRGLANVDSAKIAIIKQEIEGWYLAGLTKETIKKLRMRTYGCTDELTKEHFCGLRPKRCFCELSLKIDMLERYSVPEARRRNKSFDYFWVKYCSGDRVREAPST